MPRQDYDRMSLQELVKAGLGWEDVAVIMKKRGRKVDIDDLRRYVLNKGKR